MSASPHPIRIKDDLGREHVFASAPKRIVSLVPSITETLVFLGAGDRIVGRTKYCVHPEEALIHVPLVGGTKNPNLQRVLSLSPDLVITNREENRKRHVEALEGEVPVFVTYPRTVQETIKTVVDLGTLTAALEKADEFAEQCKALLRSIANDPATSKPLRTACLIWRDPWMAAGPETYMGDLMATLGFHPIFKKGAERYPMTSLEAIVQSDPQVILLPDEPYSFEEKDKAFIEDVLTTHGVSARVVLLIGSYLTWFGARTLEALTYLREVKKELL